MKVIRGICVQTAQFQIGERETCPVLGHRGQNAGIRTVTALAGQLIPILNILQTVFLRPAYSDGRNAAFEYQLHFRFDIIGAPK